jgi:hypothetical protein
MTTFGQVLLALMPLIAMVAVVLGGWWVWPKDGGPPPWKRRR